MLKTLDGFDKQKTEKLDKSDNLSNLSNKESLQKTLNNMEFEEAFSKLQAISKKLDSGEISLSQTIKYLEYATILKAHCKKILENFKLKVQEIANSNEDENDQNSSKNE